MKKLLLALLALVLIVSVGSFAETAIEEVDPLVFNFDAVPTDYAGTWVLTSAYEIDNGFLTVPENACTIVINAVLLENKMVDMARYIHADVYELQGQLSFSHPNISVEPYKCNSNWDIFTSVRVIGEGECEVSGANKIRIRDDDQGLFFDVLTGVTVEDMELMEFIGLNANGELVIGYSDDNAHKRAGAEWLYAYIFTKVEAIAE